MSHRVAVSLITLCTVLTVVRVPFGCDLLHGSGDEGFYLSTVERYRLGDLPMFDEHGTAGISFDLVDLGLSYLLPWDTLLAWRFLGLGLTIVALGTLTYSLRPWLPPGIAPALYSVCIMFTPFNIWTPNYKNLSLIFLSLAVACVAFAVSTPETHRRRLFAVISTCLFSVAVVCYVTLMLTAVIPAAYFVFIRLSSKTRDGRMASDLALFWLTALAVTGVTAICVLIFTHWGAQAISNIRDIQQDPRYSAPLLVRIREKLLGHGLWKELAVFLSLALAGAWAASKKDTRVSRLGTISLRLELAALVLMFAFTAGIPGSLQTEYATLSQWLFLLNLALIVGVLVYSWKTCPLATLRNSAGTWLLIFAGATAFVFILSASLSSSYITESNCTSWLLWVALAFQVASVSRFDSDLRRGHQILCTVLAAVGAVAILHLWLWTYCDLRPWKLDSVLHTGKLTGTLTTRSRMREIEALDKLLAAIVRPGDYALNYGGFSALNWLTATRPPLYSTLILYDHPPDSILQRWLAAMVQAGREPTVVVTLYPIRQWNSLEKWIEKNYCRAKDIGSVGIWVPRDRTQCGGNPSPTNLTKILPVRPYEEESETNEYYFRSKESCPKSTLPPHGGTRTRARKRGLLECGGPHYEVSLFDMHMDRSYRYLLALGHPPYGPFHLYTRRSAQR